MLPFFPHQIEIKKRIKAILSTASHQPATDISLSETFLYWLKPGVISFGEPAGQIALLRFKSDTIKLVFACAITGLVVSYLR